MFEILPGMALNLAMTTVIAQCVGAGAYDQVKYYTKKLMMMTYAGIWMINIVIVLLLPVILRAYNLSDATADISRQIMYLQIDQLVRSKSWPFSFSLPCTLRAAVDAQVTMYISLASMWICRIVFSYIFGKYMGMGVFGVRVAMVLDLYRTIYIHDNPLQEWKMDAEESHLNVTVQPGGECLLMSKNSGGKPR